MPGRAGAVTPGSPSLAEIGDLKQRPVMTVDPPETHNSRLARIELSARQELPAPVVGVVSHKENRRSTFEDVPRRQRSGVGRIVEWPLVHAFTSQHGPAQGCETALRRFWVKPLLLHPRQQRLELPPNGRHDPRKATCRYAKRRMWTLRTSPSAAKWLASWIRDPARHSPRTRMPSPLLDTPSPPTPLARAGEGSHAADIAAYLMASKDWEPKALPPLMDADLDELAVLYLSKVYPQETAAKYVRDGIPASIAGEMPPDVAELLGPMTPENRTAKKLRYVGQRTVRKRGCFGCYALHQVSVANQPIGEMIDDFKSRTIIARGKMCFCNGHAHPVAKSLPKRPGSCFHPGG